VRHADSIFPIKVKERSYRRVTACYSLSITSRQERSQERGCAIRQENRKESILLTKEGRSKSRFQGIDFQGKETLFTKEAENLLQRKTCVNRMNNLLYNSLQLMLPPPTLPFKHIKRSDYNRF
jgi:hypothetical protein